MVNIVPRDDVFSAAGVGHCEDEAGIKHSSQQLANLLTFSVTWQVSRTLCTFESLTWVRVILLRNNVVQLPKLKQDCVARVRRQVVTHLNLSYMQWNRRHHHHQNNRPKHAKKTIQSRQKKTLRDRNNQVQA